MLRKTVVLSGLFLCWLELEAGAALVRFFLRRYSPFYALVLLTDASSLYFLCKYHSSQTLSGQCEFPKPLFQLGGGTLQMKISAMLLTRTQEKPQGQAPDSFVCECECVCECERAACFPRLDGSRRSLSLATASKRTPGDTLAAISNTVQDISLVAVPSLFAPIVILLICARDTAEFGSNVRVHASVFGPWFFPLPFPVSRFLRPDAL